MNILYITNHLNIGGVTTYVVTLASAMKERGHTVYVASSDGEMREVLTRRGIQFIPIPIKTKKEIGPKIFVSMVTLTRAVRKYNIQVLHSHSRTTQVLATLVARKTGARHIFTCHGFFKRRILRRLFPCWGDKVIAISEQVREHLVHDFSVDEKKIALIHNGIDVTRFTAPSPKAQFAIKSELSLRGGPVIGIVARLSDVKGHKYLIDAMKRVFTMFPHAQLLIVGDGKMKDALVEQVRRLGIETSVFFVPTVKDTARVLSVMDVFVLPSLKEGLGLSLMEAMASGLAVVGSDIGGIKTLIQHTTNGLLVKPQDVEGLASAILELLKDPEKRAAFGREARRFIGEHFAVSTMAEETERVYSECVSA